jgi:hypothetical protein
MELKKYINQIEMNKIAKSALAMVLAGTFTFSSAAMANETTVEPSQIVEAPTETSVTNDTVALTNDVTVQEKDETKAEAPKLVPGDFFYFAKLTLEKIRLMLTIDDVKEAALLATFASDRLAEAESLFKEGKEDLAVETIKKALEGMKVADSVVEEEKEKEKEIEKDTTTVEEEKVTTEDQTKTDGQVVTEPTADKTTDTVAVLDEEPKSDEKAVEEVKVILSQNIIALTAAMEKVKNPVAKAALQRNIEKSYAKLEKKLAKIEARLAKDTEEAEVEEDTDVVITDQEKTTNTVVEVEKDNSVTETTEVTLTDEETEEATAVIPVVKKAKSEEKKAKAVVKQEEKSKKQEAKSKKQEAKDKKQEAKKVAKEKRQKENKETKGNAHKENKGKSQEKKNDNK